MPFWLEQPAVAFIREEAGSLRQVELSGAVNVICWKLVIRFRSPVSSVLSFALPWLLQLLLFTVRLFSGWRWCVTVCRGTTWRWAFRTVDGDMGLQLPLIICVDFLGVERQKPLVSHQDLQQKLCTKGTGLLSSASSVFHYYDIHVPACVENGSVTITIMGMSKTFGLWFEKLNSVCSVRFESGHDPFYWNAFKNDLGQQEVLSPPSTESMEKIWFAIEKSKFLFC